MVINVGDRFKAGDICPETGVYHFDGYIDGSQYPRPRLEESIIRIKKGQEFPDIRSLKRKIIWELISKHY